MVKKTESETDRKLNQAVSGKSIIISVKVSPGIAMWLDELVNERQIFRNRSECVNFCVTRMAVEMGMGEMPIAEVPCKNDILKMILNELLDDGIGEHRDWTEKDRRIAMKEFEDTDDEN